MIRAAPDGRTGTPIALERIPGPSNIGAAEDRRDGIKFGLTGVVGKASLPLRMA